MRKPAETMAQHAHGKTYSYEYTAVPEHGKRTVNVVVTAGELKGKSALIIKMPDEFSGFFPEVDSSMR
ncbi:MAG: hypothetical protein LWW97_09690 [Deltaproteobacteria bacterium]|nr:hypothetical protein [Deltaproteobacteria bacterium]